MENWLLWVSALCLLLFLYPYSLYPAFLRLLKPKPVAVRDGEIELNRDGPSLSLIFCAYNEEASLPAKIENIRALCAANPGLEVLAYSDASTDRTLTLLQAAAPMIRVIHGETRFGKTHGMNLLVEAARAPVVICSNTNVILEPRSPAAALRAFADPEVGCVCGRLSYTNPRDSETAAVRADYWRLEEKIKDLETATGSTMGADGALFAVRRALYQRAPPDMINDMFVSLSVLCGGHRVVKAPGFAAYEATAADSDDEFGRNIRIACQAFNCHRHLWPRLRRLPANDLFKYVSHKLIRWHGIYFLGLAAVCVGLWLVLSGHGEALFISVVGLLTVAILLRELQVSLFAKLWEHFLALTATGWGLIRSLRGDRFQTWTGHPSG